MMINNQPLTIAVVVGEPSGDILGAGLMRALKSRISNINFVGVAGPLMQEEGCKSWYKMEELSVMGIVEILSSLCRLLHIRADLTDRFSKLKPDVFIGIDAPDFNLTLENNLKKIGIKTVHYVSPSIWAWRQKRVLKIGKSTDMILVLLPFEKEFYNKFNIPCRFIGHATADTISLNPDKDAARAILGISHSSRCIALLPGSRSSEIKMLSAIFLQAAQILYRLFPNLVIVVPLVNSRCREQFERIKTTIAPELIIIVLDNNSRQNREAIIACDAAIVASGTATLECMLAKCPMVVGYRMKAFTYWLAKLLVKTEYISLPNILAGRALVKELLQKKCRPKELADALIPMLTDSNNNKEMYNIFRELHQKIRCNANEQAADAILELINKR